MKLIAILLTVSLGSAFKLRGLANDTIQQQLSLNVTQEKDAGYYSRITNGHPATHGQFPYQVGLRVRFSDNFGNGGGSILSHEWLLTAAHVLLNSVSVDVRIGGVLFVAHHIFFPQVPKYRMIEHRDYDPNTYHQDIALIRIPPILFSDYIYAVYLPPHNFRAHEGSYVSFAGWGRTKDSSDHYSPDLRYSSFKIISNHDCAEFFTPGKIYPGKICTETSNQISGCIGDSGGALVLVERHMQIGIGSFITGLGCEMGYPNAFNRVSHYLDWIHRHTGLPV